MPPPARFTSSLADQVQSWLAGLALLTLAVGAAGLAVPLPGVLVVQPGLALPEKVESADIQMLELAAPGEVEPGASLDSEAESVEISLEVVEPVLPAAVMSEELPASQLQVFEVPAAADLLSMTPLREPSPPRTRAAASPPAPSSVAGGQPAGTTEGAGNASRGASRGYYPAPPYPAAARSRRLEGVVELRVSFDPDGRVISAVVVRSSGFAILDQSASDWVKRRWRGPGGQASVAQQVVRFKLL